MNILVTQKSKLNKIFLFFPFFSFYQIKLKKWLCFCDEERFCSLFLLSSSLHARKCIEFPTSLPERKRFTTDYGKNNRISVPGYKTFCSKKHMKRCDSARDRPGGPCACQAHVITATPQNQLMVRRLIFQTNCFSVSFVLLACGTCYISLCAVTRRLTNGFFKHNVKWTLSPDPHLPLA